jgi:hypothetical protein
LFGAGFFSSIEEAFAQKSPGLKKDAMRAEQVLFT